MPVDPRTISPGVFVAQVRYIVLGTNTPKEAQEQIKAYFSPSPEVAVVGVEGESYFGVMIQQYEDAEVMSITCER